jgi:predicted ATP-grasp superfamily ATP-dependent carboligase
MRTPLPVVVAKIHHGSLGIARSLGRLGVEVHGITAAPGAPAARSRYWRACHRADLEALAPAQAVDFLLDLGRRLGRPALLIAVSDDLAQLMADHAEALAERFVFPALPSATVRALTSKKEMHHLAQRLGIPTPGTEFPAARPEVLAFAERARFPVTVKGIDGARLKRRAGCTLAFARDAGELLDLYDRMEEPDGAPNLMLQEFIPGGEDSVWMFNGYFDARGECPFALTGKKIRQNPVYRGSTSLGICLANPEVDRLTRTFMKAIGYRGILDIGYRFDARDGRYKVLDVNPRIGSSFRLFVDANGLDVVRALYLDMTGQPVPRQAPLHGRKWVVEDQDLESCLRYRADGRLPLRQWLSSYGGVREGAWFARDDLRPFLAVAHELGRSAARRLVSGRPRRQAMAGRAT